jgi:hypothetical protein
MGKPPGSITTRIRDTRSACHSVFFWHLQTCQVRKQPILGLYLLEQHHLMYRLIVLSTAAELALASSSAGFQNNSLMQRIPRPIPPAIIAVVIVNGYFCCVLPSGTRGSSWTLWRDPASLCGVR